MKGNRLLVRFFFVPLGCLSLSYAAMCVYWLVTGCRYGVKVCTSVFVDSLPFTLIISGVAAAVSGTVAIKRIKRFTSAMEKCRKSSGAPEDIAELDKALGALKYKGAYVSLLRASALLGCGCYDECLGELEGIDLAYLSAEDEEEYFNMLIYCRLMQGEKETALRLYLLSGHYFRRALGRRGTSHIRHTVGMIYYTVGEYDKALKLFEESKKDADCALLCECDLWSGLCFLKLGSGQQALDCAKRAAENVSDARQQKSLIHLKNAAVTLTERERRAAQERQEQISLQELPTDNTQL